MTRNSVNICASIVKFYAKKKEMERERKQADIFIIFLYGVHHFRHSALSHFWRGQSLFIKTTEKTNR